MRGFLWRAILPALLAIGLFCAAIFGVLIPRLERVILEQKKEMIRELVNAAWNVFARHQHDEERGLLTREQAQKAAIAQILDLHYGRQMKDYFWINDLHPRMVVHPYRPELNGQDLSTVADPDGVRLFQEAVRVVHEEGAGYIRYRWQFRDDASRVVPKLSYVKGFTPWGWIIGTGVYLDDVRLEVRAATHQSLLVALAVVLMVSFLLAYLLWEHFGAERRRRRAEGELRASEERYRMLVESAGESLLLTVEGLPLFANPRLLGLLGYEAAELAQLSLDDLLLPTPAESQAGKRFYRELLRGGEAPTRYEGRLRGRDGALRDVMLSLSRVTVQERSGLIVVATDVTRERETALLREQTLGELQASLMFLDRAVREVCRREIVTCRPEQAIGEVALALAARGFEAALVCAGDGRPLGLVTVWQLLAALAAGPAAGARPVASLPPEALVCVAGEAQLAEASLLLAGRGAGPVFVTDAAGVVNGVLAARDLLLVQQHSPALLLREIASAPDAAAMARANRRLPELVRVFSESGAKARHLNRLITQNADAVIARALQLAGAELGPAPVPFAFLVLGSEGRHEQTLRTDQDNAILFADVEPAALATTTAWFQRLGTLVSGWLEACGYAVCEGEVMARNPRWVQPLAQWKREFSAWTGTLEAQDLLHSKIFFDFRAAAGDQGLVRELRRSLYEGLADHPRFFFLLARNVLLFRPPLGMLGDFSLERDAHGRESFDIKGVMTLLVDFARIYALKNNIDATNTRQRLAALASRGILSRQSHGELLAAFDFLMQLRLEQQVRAVAAGRQPDNRTAPDELTAIEQKMLKEVFSQIQSFQVRLSLDFTGSLGEV